MKELKAELPNFLRRLEGVGCEKLCVPRSQHRDAYEMRVRLRIVGVPLCYSLDLEPNETARVTFGFASPGEYTIQGNIAGAVNENLLKKVKKLLAAKCAGAAEAHLFLWQGSAANA